MITRLPNQNFIFADYGLLILFRGTAALPPHRAERLCLSAKSTQKLRGCASLMLLKTTLVDRLLHEVSNEMNSVWDPNIDEPDVSRHSLKWGWKELTGKAKPFRTVRRQSR
jgi:hypothetical protein